MDEVLITGGCGFIGSHTAEKFAAEGYRVVIIDNLSTGLKNNLNFSHKLYELDVASKDCENIFRNHRFSIVIHLASQNDLKKSIDDPYYNARTNILGLVNMLHLSTKYNAGRFIFGSSSAVYGNNETLPLKEEYEINPISPYGTGKYLGEYYCNKWKEIYGLDTVCLRFSNVYGPRQGVSGENRVVSNFIKKADSGLKLVIFGDGEQTRDFIYVSDVVDAIYRAIYSTNSSILNISSGSEVSIKYLANEINKIRRISGIRYEMSRDGDIRHSVLDNTKAKQELDWAPMYSLKEGLEKTFKWYSENKFMPHLFAGEKKEKKQNKNGIFKKLFPYIENVLLFIVFAWLSDISKISMGIKIDFMILYILLIGITHGLRQSSISMLLSSILFLYNSFNEGKDIAFLIYDINTIFYIANYFIVGIGTGYVIDKKNYNINNYRKNEEDTNHELSLLNRMYDENLKIKNSLQDQILSSENSFGKIYSIISELDSLEPANVFNSTVSVIGSAMKSEEVSIYSLSGNGHYLRLIARSKGSFSFLKSIKLDDMPQIKDIVENGQIFVNKKLDNSLPVLAAPIVNDKKTVAVIMIKSVKFEQLSLHYINLFRIIIQLITATLVRAYVHQAAIEEKKYIRDTLLLNSDAYKQILKIKKDSFEKEQSECSFIRIDKKYKNLTEISDKLNNLIRDDDYAGMDENGTIYVILSNTNRDNAINVKMRMAYNGIPVTILDFMEEFDEYSLV
jgi:UDP-glucuronate decarboxylase